MDRIHLIHFLKSYWCLLSARHLWTRSQSERRHPILYPAELADQLFMVLISQMMKKMPRECQGCPSAHANSVTHFHNSVTTLSQQPYTTEKEGMGNLKFLFVLFCLTAFIRQSNMNFYLDKGTSMFEQLFTQGKTPFNKIAVTCFQ